MKKSDNDLSEALILYVGWKVSRSPRMDASVVAVRFGQSSGDRLLEVISKIFQDVNTVSIDWSKETLITAGQIARDYAHHLYPGLSEEALKALEWKYTFDWR